MDREADSEDDWDEDQDDDVDGVENEVEYDKKPTTDAKRKADVPKGRGRPPKKAKTVIAQLLVYMLRSRCREIEESMIYYQDEQRTIAFNDKNLVSLTATAALPCLGQHAKFTGRKISNVPACSRKSWNDYSERAHERERVGRWH